MRKIVKAFSMKDVVDLTRINLFILVICGTARCLLPFLEDQKELFATSNQADLSNQIFPANVFMQWDMKPWPTRFVYYLLFRLFHPFYESKFFFIVLVQALLVLLIWLTLKGLTSLLPKQLRLYFMNFAFFALIFTTPTIFFQPEFIAIILSLFAFTLLNNPKNWVRYSGEAILMFVTSLKGITLFFSAFTLLVILAIRNKSKSPVRLFIFRNLIINTISLMIIRNEVTSSAIAQGRSNHNFSNLFSLSNLQNVYVGSKDALIDMPFLIFLPPLFVLILFRGKGLWIKFLYATLCGLFLLSLIFQVTNSYHYSFFLLVLLLSFFLLEEAQQISRYRYFFSLPLVLLIALIIIKFWIPVTVNSTSISFGNSNSKIAASFSDLAAEIREFSQIQKEIGSGDVLFLTDGTANFYLNNRSACQEYLPVHFQRSLMYPTLKEIRASFHYNNFLQCARSYKGKFVLLQTSWIPTEHAIPILGAEYFATNQFDTGIRDYTIYVRKG